MLPQEQINLYIAEQPEWQRKMLVRLRQLIHSVNEDITETWKWNSPHFDHDGIMIGLHGFKSFVSVWFHKGALLNDRHGILIQQTPNVQSARQVRFTGVKGIARLKPALIGYVNEAMALERAGSKVVLKKTKEFDMPEEFAARLKAAPALREAFEGLTPGRQRGYLLHFAAAKQSKTREARIEKHAERILRGKGLDD